MRKHRVLTLGASLLVLLSACTTGGGGSPSASTAATSAPSSAAPSEPASASAPASESTAPSESAGAVTLEGPTVRIGSDDFYESRLVAEMYAQALENAGLEVERKFGLGARQARQPALEAGEIDMVPEYVGSGVGFYDPARTTGDGEENRATLEELLADKGGGISVFAISPGEDTNAAVVRQDTATEFNLSSMSDLAAVQDELRWGLPPDCDANPLCKGALEEYGITYPPAQREALAACDAPIADALNGNAIDFAWLCSTQPAISQYGFVVLEDDLDTQPAENMAPIVRNDYLEQVNDADAFQAVLDAVSETLTTEALTELGVRVAVDQEDVEDVAADWLTEQGLLSGG
jgi:osmoprotectant transport system substrate-binding protein